MQDADLDDLGSPKEESRPFFQPSSRMRACLIRRHISLEQRPTAVGLALTLCVALVGIRVRVYDIWSRERERVVYSMCLSLRALPAHTCSNGLLSAPSNVSVLLGQLPSLRKMFSGEDSEDIVMRVGLDAAIRRKTENTHTPFQEKEQGVGVTCQVQLCASKQPHRHQQHETFCNRTWAYSIVLGITDLVITIGEISSLSFGLHGMG